MQAEEGGLEQRANRHGRMFAAAFDCNCCLLLTAQRRLSTIAAKFSLWRRLKYSFVCGGLPNRTAYKINNRRHKDDACRCEKKDVGNARSREGPHTHRYKSH